MKAKKKYEKVVNKSTKEKVYFPIIFGSLVEIPHPSARLAEEFANKMELEISQQETTSSIKSGEAFGAPAIIQGEPKT